MPQFNLPAIDFDQGQNARFSCGNAGASPFAELIPNGTDKIVMPDGNVVSSIISTLPGSTVHINSVSGVPSLWFIIALTGTWRATT